MSLRTFYCWSSSAGSELEDSGVAGRRWLETDSGLGPPPCGTPLRVGSGRVRVSGADFLRGRSLGTRRDSGASVHMGVEGALAGPVSAQEDRGVSLIEMDGGNMPIFWLVASWMVRSNSLTSSIVMSGFGKQKTGAKSEPEAELNSQFSHKHYCKTETGFYEQTGCENNISKG